MLDLDLGLSGQRTGGNPLKTSFCNLHGPDNESRLVKAASCANEGTVCA